MELFRYYIVNLYDGTITKTNSQQTAKDFSFHEGFAVIDIETSEVVFDGGGIAIKEIN